MHVLASRHLQPLPYGWLFFSLKWSFFSSFWQCGGGRIYFLHAAFTFHSPDKTLSLQRKSNLIFNIFSMKSNKEHSFTPERAKYSRVLKGRIARGTVSSRFCLLQAGLNEERTAKWREIYPVLSVVTKMLQRNCHELLMAWIGVYMNQNY